VPADVEVGDVEEHVRKRGVMQGPGTEGGDLSASLDRSPQAEWE
jgi:hypothetical protein